MGGQRDTLNRFLIDVANVRGELVYLDESWRRILECADYPSVIRELLGDAMAATALMAATIKFSGSLTLQVRGNGPVNLLVMQSTADGAMRGLAKWQSLPEKPGLAEIFGDGQMVITIDPGEGKDQYQGVVAVDGDKLADAIGGYFAQSEQLPTTLHLFSSEQRAMGLLLQKLPGQAEDADGWERLQHLASTITRDEALSLGSETMLHRLFHEEELRLLDDKSIRYQCGCSRDRTAAMVKSLGHAEADEILKEQGVIEVTCEFCNTRYRFDAIDAEQLFIDVAAKGSKTLH